LALGRSDHDSHQRLNGQHSACPETFNQDIRIIVPGTYIL
jgi:hypothetical protein